MNKETNKVNGFLELLDSSNDTKWDSLDDWFYEIANYLMNQMVLQIGDTSFRITECEIYYEDGVNHSDPYIHRDAEQLTKGNLYLNRVGGLDITFGNEDSEVYAGILIRGIRNIENSERFNRVTKITEEVFRRLGNVVLHVGQIRLRPLQQGDRIKVETPYKTRRVGLRRKENDERGYINESYRYIVELVADHKFQGKESVAKEMLESERTTREKVKDVLGYNLGQ